MAMSFSSELPGFQAALEALKSGSPVVFPTDTLYGLGVSVRDAESPEVLYEIKKRPQRKPVAWLVSGVDDLRRYGSCVPEYVFALARTFWPGPLTIVVQASAEVPEAFRSAQDTIGLRCPAGDTALDLIRELGCPIATTSANLSGRKPPMSADQLDSKLTDQAAAVLCDQGEKSGVASTIVDCSQGHPVLLREGSISLDEIRARS